MSIFKTLATAAATGMLPAILSPIMGRDTADKIVPHLKNAMNTISKKNLDPSNSSMKDLLGVIKETGMTKQQLMSSLNYLSNSKVGQVLNRFSPDLVNSLRGVGQEAYNSMGDDRLTSALPAQTRGITSKYPSNNR